MIQIAYIDENEYSLAFNNPDHKIKAQRIKCLADNRNADAAYIYGDMLLNGFWDTNKMTIYDAHKRLLLAPMDPYLIVQKDQY